MQREPFTGRAQAGRVPVLGTVTLAHVPTHRAPTLPDLLLQRIPEDTKETASQLGYTPTNVDNALPQKHRLDGNSACPS